LPIAAQVKEQNRTEVGQQATPQPPCEKQPFPPYPAPHDGAVVEAWSRSDSDLGTNWRPPGCTGWEEDGFTLLVTIAARFTNTSGADGLLRQFGAISALKGLRYWSASHKRWQTLIVEAHALKDLRSAESRADFRSDEMRQGSVLYFAEVDNLSGRALNRMQILEATPSRLVLAVENVSTIRYHLLPLFHSGELQSLYFLDHESGDVWRYYSITRTGKHVNRLVEGNESSLVNRAVAFYRHFVGIPSTQEPPVAR
jgi:hypothetical protein